MKTNTRSVAIFGILAAAAIGAFIYFKKRKEKTAAAGEAQELPSTTETTSNTSTQTAQQIYVEYIDKQGVTHKIKVTPGTFNDWLLLSTNNNGTSNYEIVNFVTPVSKHTWLLLPSNQSAKHQEIGTFNGQQFVSNGKVDVKRIEPAAKNYSAWPIVYDKYQKDIYLVKPESARAVGLIK